MAILSSSAAAGRLSRYFSPYRELIATQRALFPESWVSGIVLAPIAIWAFFLLLFLPFDIFFYIEDRIVEYALFEDSGELLRLASWAYLILDRSLEFSLIILVTLFVVAPYLAAEGVNRFSRLALNGLHRWRIGGTLLRLFAIPFVTFLALIGISGWDVSAGVALGAIGAFALIGAIAAVLAVDTLFRNWRRLNVF